METSGIKKGDKIIARTPSVVDESSFKRIGGHESFDKPLTVSKVWTHGVRTLERGYIHKNNIIKTV